MLGLNSQQIQGIIRGVLVAAGGILAAKGYIDSTQVATLADLIMQIGGGILVLVPMIHGAITHTEAAQVVATAALPNVAKVVINDSAPADSAVKIIAAGQANPDVVTQSGV